MGKPSKHQDSRGRGKICKDVNGELISMILDDNSYQTAWRFEDRTNIARKAIDKLNDPLSVLKMLKLLMKPIAMENTIFGVKAKNALEVLESVLEQPNHSVLNQYQANEFDKQFRLEGQETNMESHFRGDTVLSQGWANESYEQFPSPFQFNGQETNAESHFPGSLKQAMPMLQLEMPKHEGGSWDLDSSGILNNFKNSSNLEGLKIVDNANNTMIEAMLDMSEVTTFKGYTVSKHNANVVAEIFDKYPDIDEKFQLKHPSNQLAIMTSLAEVYHKIGSETEMLELKHIPGMKLMVQDMESTGLKVPWLKEMLEKVSKMLEDKADKAERKRLQEEIISLEAKKKEAKVKLAKLEKKPRVE